MHGVIRVFRPVGELCADRSKGTEDIGRGRAYAFPARFFGGEVVFSDKASDQINL